MSAISTIENLAVAQAVPSPVRVQEWLTFRLGHEEYGIDILRVQEIRSYEPPTRIADSPAHVKGVINLRGDIVPILDLRVRFGSGDRCADALTVIIVLNIHEHIVGAVVDAVCDVLELLPADIKPFPPLSSSTDPSFVTGIGSLKTDGRDRMLILMDVVAVVTSMDLARTANARGV